MSASENTNILLNNSLASGEFNTTLAMKGKVRACNNCCLKKIKCEGANPCKYCQNHSIECTYASKRIAARSVKKKENTVSVKTTSAFKDKTRQIETRLAKIISLLDNVVDKLEEKNNDMPIDVSEQTDTSTTSADFSTIPITGIDNDNEFKTEDVLAKESLVVRGGFNNSPFEIYDKMTSGDYFSISYFSVNGLMWAVDHIKDPFVSFQVKNLIPNFVSMERSLLSVWTDPVDDSRLDSLPSRETIYTIITSFDTVDMYDLPYVKEVTKIIERYCDYRDGLITRQNFTYGELLFLNSCLLFGCAIHYEMLKVGMVSEDLISSEQVKVYEKLLLDNSLYYFHRVSVLDEGIDSIKGLTLLCFYGDIYSLSQPYYSITTYMIRRAQDLGLHKDEYYYTLDEVEANNSLSLWWICYYLDKFSALQTGKVPMTNDKNVTAPPLTHLQEYCDNFRHYGPRAGLRRNELHKEISQKSMRVISSKNGIQKFYFIMEIDLAIIISKLYQNLLSCDSLDDHQALLHVNALLNDLENWKLCLPESIRDDGSISKFTKITKFDNVGACTYYIVCDLNLTFYYLKMVISMYGVRITTGLVQRNFAKQGLKSAKDLLKLAIGVEQRAVRVSGYCLFYCFSAYLTLAAFCMQGPSEDEVIEDVIFLMDCCRKLFACFSQTKGCPEKWILIGAVSRCVLYITVHVVMEHNAKLYFDVSALLGEVSEIQKTPNFKHLCLSYDNKTDKKIGQVSNGKQ